MKNFELNSSYSSLYPIFNGKDPIDSFSKVPFEKGYQFLVFLESLMLKPRDFYEFITFYFEKYQF